MIKKCIERIIYYCSRLENHINTFGNDKEIFLVNEQYQDACSLIFIQIGEFVGRLSDDFIEEHSDIPWQAIRGMRNKNAHNYDHILYDVVWETMQEDIPELKAYLEKLL